MSSEPRIAFVLDALPSVGGGEKTLFAALEAFPRADLFTLIYNRRAFLDTPIAGRNVTTSLLDRWPLAHTRHRLLLPLMPLAVERLDLRGYDLVVSFSYAVAHGVRPQDGARHLTYMYTPMRYAWSDINLDGTRSRKSPLVDLLMESFRRWDRSAAARVDAFAAISHGIAQRIRFAYGREAQVIYPPVEVERFSPAAERGRDYVTLSRLVPHKRLDVVVEAFSRLGLPIKIVGEGPQRKALEQHAAPNVEFLGYRPDDEVARLLARARGFVCAAEEDFGIAIVEAQAAGCPVIVYGGGGALETVVEGQTGLFFAEQSADSLIEALREFEEAADCFRPAVLVENARQFSKARFREALRDFVDSTESPAHDRGRRGQ